jgi:GAF domain-containing protein
MEGFRLFGDPIGILRVSGGDQMTVGDDDKDERQADGSDSEHLERASGPLAGAHMMRGLAAVSDPARLAALHETRLLDSGPEERFDRLAKRASHALGAPVALVSLVDEDRQFFKSCIGLPEPWQSRRETPLTHSFCKHAVASGRPLIVDDAREDPELQSNHAIDDLGVIAYAGIPLVDLHGHALGALCVIDNEPRHWSLEDINLLKHVAASVVTEVELSRADAESN